jgi:hypothetical protein
VATGATFAPIPGTDISSSMEQLLMKTRGIVNKKINNKNPWLFFLS